MPATEDPDDDLEGLSDEELLELLKEDQRPRALATARAGLRVVTVLLFASLVTWIGSAVAYAFLSNPNRETVSALVSDSLLRIEKIQSVSQTLALTSLLAMGGMLLANELSRRLHRESDDSEDDSEEPEPETETVG